MRSGLLASLGFIAAVLSSAGAQPFEESVELAGRTLGGGFERADGRKRLYGVHKKRAEVERKWRARRATGTTTSSATAASSSAKGSSSTSSSTRSTTTTTSTTAAPSTTASTLARTTSPTSSSTSSGTTRSSTAAAMKVVSLSSTASKRSLTTTSATSTSATSTQPLCAPTYSAATMVTGTGTLPRPTTFVRRSGQGLFLDGAPYRIVGPNIYWLCNDENVAPLNAPTEKSRVREALAIAVAMGGNTVRLTSCGTSVGSQYSVEPSLGQFTNWDIRDYVIYAAGKYGLRIILPMTDDYDFYYGSKYTFLRFRGVDTGNFGNAFYTDPTVISDFQTYVAAFLSHQNPYTGLAYAQDPTILAYETGNELGAYIGYEGYPPASWTSAVTQAMKSNAPNQLTVDGTDGFWNYSTGATAPGLNVGAVDIMTDHGYPRNLGILNKEIGYASAAYKAFLIGEYDWRPDGQGVTLPEYLSAIEQTSYLGDMIWSIQGHDAQCCQYVTHDDGYSIYYPNGPNIPDEQANILQVVQHYYRMTGRPVPSVLPGVSCPQPAF